ncbi:MAG: SEC-C domain-containing protein [Rhodocyclaceae bacterium]|nr:SEC-C domain-containing protein [Rhodocyclaceae bacterium]
MTNSKIPRRKSKTGANDPCPCGSGKKYKKCHNGIGMQPTFTPGRIDAQVRKLAPPRKCLVPASMTPSCSKGTIEAHTVSRSGSLGAIARDSHVYSYKLSVQSLQKARGKIQPTLVGWRDASTFPGFCGVHDKSLFAPLEDKPFICSPQQCFLLAYRIVVREYYAKMDSARQSEFRDVLASRDESLLSYTNALNHGVDIGLQDSLRHKQRYDRVLEASDWNSVKAVVFRFDGIFPIQCAGGFFPESDVSGKVVQIIGIDKKLPDAITLSSFAAGGCSYVSFCWLVDSDHSCSAYIDGLLAISQGDLPVVLSAAMLQTSENCHFSPDWYDMLPERGRDWICLQIYAGIPAILPLPAPEPPAA